MIAFRLLLLFIILYAGCFRALAGNRDPDTPKNKYTELANNYQHTGQIVGKNTSNSLWSGSCVAIHDKIIVTAAHFMHDARACTVSINNKDIKVVRWRTHNNFNIEIIGQHDIAIGLLEENIGLKTYPELYRDANERGKFCYISGFGFTGTFDSPCTEYDNRLLAGSNLIDKIYMGVLVCSPSKKDKTELEYLIAPGDSGGGLFIDGKLAGVHSATTKPKSKDPKIKVSEYLSESYHTRISDHVVWVESTKQEFLKEK